MENIRKVESVSEILDEIPFIPFIPRNFEMFNCTLRVEGKKWSTLRFEAVIDGEKVRVKEFFLDWFYQGFPKSLMDSFISTYSAVDSFRNNDFIFFLGKDYRGMHASSAFLLGTQLEIEGESRSSVVEMSMDLNPVGNSGRFKRLPFYVRSFFARGGIPEWFEERRIASLNWGPLGDEYSMGNLRGDSQGTFTAGGKNVHKISILSEDYMKRVVWVDCSLDSEERAYRLRKGGNFFNRYLETKGLLAFREPDGPSIFQSHEEGSIITVSFSPLYSLDEVMDIIGDLYAKRKNLFLL